MTNIVEIKGKKLFTDTRTIAEGVGVDHRSVMKLYKRHSGESLLLDTSVSKVSKGGRPLEFVRLNELQATFLITLLKNTPKVIEFKSKLTTEFYRQRQVIEAMKRQSGDDLYQQVRGDGKQIYFQKTDVIKQFVDYAIAQGSKNSQRYYSNIANMENKALFFLEQKYDNVRNLLDTKQLMNVATADHIIEKALKDGMLNSMNYKEIYLLAKERIEAYAEIIGKSPVQRLIEANQ